jgi:hypothetical protein
LKLNHVSQRSDTMCLRTAGLKKPLNASIPTDKL